MITRKQLEQVVADSGLWNSGQENYKFVLSPDVFRLSCAQKQEVEELGTSLQECLSGLGRIAAIAATPTLSSCEMWGRIGRILRVGLPSLYNGLATIRPGRTPTICKVDIMEDNQSHLHVAEIDGHNKHGLGYSTLGQRFRKLCFPKAQAFPGVAVALAKAVKAQNPKSANLVVLYADQERFYDPDFRILQQEMQKYGVQVNVVPELKLAEKKSAELKEFLKSQTLWLDLPVMYHNDRLGKMLAEFYQEGRVDFLLPPKPFFGSKAVLGLLRNEERDEELEAVLRSQIPGKYLTSLRRFLPQTFLIRKGRDPAFWQELCRHKRFVLKECVASGMKGTIFSDDEEFEAELARACQSQFLYVLQEEVPVATRRFSYFDEEGDLKEDRWYTRITVHFNFKKVADVIATARPDKKVHGAPDCLQLGTIIEERS